MVKKCGTYCNNFNTGLFLLFISISLSVNALTIDELSMIFDEKDCIEGVLVSMPTTGPTLITTAPVLQQASVKTATPAVVPADGSSQVTKAPTSPQASQSLNKTTTNMPNTLSNNKEKTSLSQINELAQYNNIQHQYSVTSEKGPPHNKRFTVTLKLGNEEYEAEGASIKNAQHSAAAEALTNTQFKHPPQKVNKANRSGNKHVNGRGMPTSTIEQNVAMKQGERTLYVMETVPPSPYVAQPGNSYGSHRNDIYEPNEQPNYNLNETRGHYMNNDQRYAYNQYKVHNEKSNDIPRVGSHEYTGEGHTIQADQHNAASKTLSDLKQLPIPGEQENVAQCPATNDAITPDSLSNLNSELKSPISLVHEIALKRNLNVEFQVLSEKGPPHMKVFVTICKVGDLVAEGEGNGKKMSKTRAAEKMLEELAKLSPLPNLTKMAPRLKRKRVKTKSKIRNLIKANQEKVGSGYGEYIKNVVKQAAAQALGYGKTTNQPVKTSIKSEKKIHAEPKKQGKVKFREDKISETPVGGSSGRHLVPGLLLMDDQIANYPQEQNQAKLNINVHHTASIAEELLKTRTSPTADALDISNTGNKFPSPQLINKQIQSSQAIHSKDQLLYMAQLLGVQVQFSDFPKANHEEYLTLVSLSTTPPKVCHGVGPTTESSHEKASLVALTVLSELVLDNVIPKKNQPNDGVNPTVMVKSDMINNGIKK